MLQNFRGYYTVTRLEIRIVFALDRSPMQG